MVLAQGALPLRAIARRPGDGSQSVVETPQQPVRAQHPQPGGGQLDGQRQPVETPADGDHVGDVVGSVSANPGRTICAR